MLFTCACIINCWSMCSLGKGFAEDAKLASNQVPTHFLLFIGYPFVVHSLSVWSKPCQEVVSPCQQSNKKAWSPGSSLSPGLFQAGVKGWWPTHPSDFSGCLLRAAAHKSTQELAYLCCPRATLTKWQRGENQSHPWLGTASSFTLSCHITSLLQPNTLFLWVALFVCNFWSICELESLKEL